MNRLRGAPAVVAALGSLLLLSACGNPAPSAVGSYRATFVAPKGSHQISFPLVLSADRHFAFEMGPNGSPFQGRWSQSGGQVTLNGKEGGTKVVLVATETGRNLSHGSFENLGRPGLKGFTLLWSAIRK